ncbi:MAG: hypothetical protein QW350_05565 [Candidatus Aenigmatarchaeota archaeon]|jgi:DNA-directed RNA polymerase subunit K/omega
MLCEEEIEEEINEEETPIFHEGTQRYPKSFEQITLNIRNAKLTKFERTRAIQVRVEQLLKGCKPMIPEKEYRNLNPRDAPYQIAVKELEMRKMPLKIIRRSPGNVVEVISLFEE